VARRALSLSRRENIVNEDDESEKTPSIGPMRAAAPALSEAEWRRSVERRLYALDLNASLAVNYCREMAKALLSREAIHAIESTTANGSDADPG
jgi:hypothetical protein